METTVSWTYLHSYLANWCIDLSIAHPVQGLHCSFRFRPFLVGRAGIVVSVCIPPLRLSCSADIQNEPFYMDENMPQLNCKQGWAKPNEA